MKKWVTLLFICSFASISPQSTISPQFSELKGMEDQQGNTHLFYRIYSRNENFPIYSYTYNDIYHLDLNTLSDSLFLRDYIESSPVMMNAITVNDYKFWNNQANQFIYAGMIGGQDPVPFINRFDQPDNLLNYFCCEVKLIDISTSDDSLIYSGGQLFAESQANTIRSSDGGFSWIPISDTLMFLSLNPFDENLLFLEGWEGSLYRSTDGATTFHLVDVMSEWGFSDSFVYDSDQLHIYRIYKNRILRVSSNNGEAFSWQTKYSSDSEIFISNDESISGTLYLADKKNVFVSTDYGDNFSLYKTLDRKIVGIYKKPDSNKLYAATKYKIYEITPDTIQVIKSLPIADEELKFYPLAIGNKWVYDTWGWWWDGTIYHTYSGIIYREVVGDSIMPNGYNYYKLSDPTTFNYPPILFERIDSASGKVFRNDNTLGLPDDEYLIDDLFAELGDTIWSSRHQYQDFVPFICVGGGVFNKWGIQGPRKIFTIYDLTGYTYSLSQGVGIDSIYSSFDFGENFTTLKGCIIDGAVYGDTTVVAIEDDEQPVTTSFKLDQNYPNPFNPTTNIGFRIANFGFVSLKVYDILGNEIATLANEELSAGEYEVEFNTSNIKHHPSSGIYFYQLKAGSFVETKKMVYLK